MKAAKVRKPGGLDRLDVVDMQDPGDPGPGEIRVRIHASSLNFHDYGIVSGRMPSEDGRIPMADGAGTVEAVGEGVGDLKAGDAVVSLFFPDWQDGPPPFADFTRTPGDGLDGYAREAVVCPASWFTRAPEGYSHAEAATLTTAGLTAWRALVVDGGLKAGDTVLTLGTGGVSIFAVQLAKAMGARVIATSSSDEKLERLQEMGAGHTINYKKDEAWGETVLKLTGGRGVDHVVEVGGPGTLAQSIAACRIGGHLALIGVLTGRAGEIPTAKLMAQAPAAAGPDRRQPPPPDRLRQGAGGDRHQARHRPDVPARGHRRRLPPRGVRLTFRQDLPGVLTKSCRAASATDERPAAAVEVEPVETARRQCRGRGLAVDPVERLDRPHVSACGRSPGADIEDGGPHRQQRHEPDVVADAQADHHRIRSETDEAELPRRNGKPSGRHAAARRRRHESELDVSRQHERRGGWRCRLRAGGSRRAEQSPQNHSCETRLPRHLRLPPHAPAIPHRRSPSGALRPAGYLPKRRRPGALAAAGPSWKIAVVRIKARTKPPQMPRPS